MKLLVLALFFLFCINFSFGQTRTKSFSNCDSGKMYSVSSGDTIVIQCERVLLLNPKYAGKYNEIIESYREENMLLEERIVELEANYLQQRQLNDSLVTKSLKHVATSENDFALLQLAMKNSIDNINTVKTDLTDLKSDIKKSMKMSALKSNILWGTGGLIIGIAACALLL